MDGEKRAPLYEVPTYRALPGAVWYHFLHGNVPGHQIDFMYLPELPAGPLTRQHFSHLGRLVKYIEPRHGKPYAFAIGNLSRDDTQYEPGRGGVALLFGLRIKGAKDHAGRQDPPFCHSVVAIARSLDEDAIYEAATAFYKKLLPNDAKEAAGGGFYHTYVRCGQSRSGRNAVLRHYVSGFDDLPKPKPSVRGLVWSMGTNTPPKRVVIVVPEETSFEQLALCAARIASVLVASDIRWTSITNGRESDIGGGVTVRFVPDGEMVQEDEGVLVVALADVPETPDELASKLFCAVRVQASATPEQRQGWRQLAAQSVEDARAEAGVVAEVKPKVETGGKRSRLIGLLIGLAVSVVMAGVIGVGMVGGGKAEVPVNAGGGVSEPVEVKDAGVADAPYAPDAPDVHKSEPKKVATPSASGEMPKQKKPGGRKPEIRGVFGDKKGI